MSQNFVKALKKFQFHNGSIKTRHHIKSKGGDFMFQFHNGSIKTAVFRSFDNYQTCFNSTMVRLKHEIKCISKMLNYCFNSTMVRLKPADNNRLLGWNRVVSIPQWFD